VPVCFTDGGDDSDPSAARARARVQWRENIAEIKEVQNIILLARMEDEEVCYLLHVAVITVGVAYAQHDLWIINGKLS